MPGPNILPAFFPAKSILKEVPKMDIALVGLLPGNSREESESVEEGFCWKVWWNVFFIQNSKRGMLALHQLFWWKREVVWNSHNKPRRLSETKTGCVMIPNHVVQKVDVRYQRRCSAVKNIKITQVHVVLKEGGTWWERQPLDIRVNLL